MVQLQTFFAIGMLALVAAGVSVANGGGVEPQVSFLEPKNGAKVTAPFTVKFTVKGMKILPAGTVEPGAGHHHLIVDGKPIPKGTVVPSDATHFHYGKGQTETELKLPPGKHTLILQFADGAHVSYGEAMSSKITVEVLEATH